MRSRFLAAAAALVAAAVPVACADSEPAGRPAVDGATTSTSAAAASVVAAEAAYAGRGPHQVGSRVIALDDRRRAVVWYPATAEAAEQPEETFDIASLLSPDLQAQIPAELRPQHPIDAHTGAAAAVEGSPYPLVAFSHGFAGFPEQSATLTTHLASWGFVVVAPEHVERSLGGLLGTSAVGVPARADVDVLGAALDAVVADEATAGSPLAGIVDGDRVAVVGHSAGASAAYDMARTDPRIDAFAALSVSEPDDAVTEGPSVPGLVMAGSIDATIDAADSRRVYDAMTAPKMYAEIADAGHLVFSDVCLIGWDQGGVVALVDQLDLDIPENLLALASDGCQEGAKDPASAAATIDHLVTAWFRYHLGVDPEPVGLDPAVADALVDAGPVTIVTAEA